MAAPRGFLAGSVWLQRKFSVAAEKRGCHLITDALLSKVPKVANIKMNWDPGVRNWNDYKNGFGRLDGEYWLVRLFGKSTNTEDIIFDRPVSSISVLIDPMKRIREYNSRITFEILSAQDYSNSRESCSAIIGSFKIRTVARNCMRRTLQKSLMSLLYLGVMGSFPFREGNDHLHELVSQGSYQLRIDLEDFSNQKRYAKYSTFSVAGSKDKYRLKVGGYTGNAGDSLAHHNGKMFSTKEADHDTYNGNCASSYKGGYWY